MNLFAQAFGWIFDPAHWTQGPDISGHLVEHISVSGLCILIAVVIAVPIGVAIGHTGKGRAGAILISNVARALPTLGLLPILLLFVFPLLSSLFSAGTSQPAMPRMVFDEPQPPYTYARKTKSNVKYFVDPKDITGIKDNPAKLSQLDNHADVTLVRTLKLQCDQEIMRKQHLREEAQGWFFQDPEKMERANKYEMKACNRLEKMNYVVR